MKLRVVFFGGLQRLAGCREVELEVQNSTPDIQFISEQITVQYPDIAPQIDSVAFSVGDELVDRKRLLRDGDEVGLLPPVSGG